MLCVYNISMYIYVREGGGTAAMDGRGEGELERPAAGRERAARGKGG